MAAPIYLRTMSTLTPAGPVEWMISGDRTHMAMRDTVIAIGTTRTRLVPRLRLHTIMGAKIYLRLSHCRSVSDDLTGLVINVSTPYVHF